MPAESATRRSAAAPAERRGAGGGAFSHNPARVTATLVLLRHGQASFGSTDYDVLSDGGRRQAVLLGAALKERYPRVGAVVTGTMRRQRDTAAATLGAMGLEAPRAEDPAWNEFDHVDVLRALEPRFRDDAELHRVFASGASPAGAFERAFLAAVSRWTSGAHDADYRETWADFLARVDGALSRALTPPGAAGGGPVLVFTSGGPISAACRVPLRATDAAGVLSNAFRIANASVTELAVDHDGFVLRTFNDCAHFAGEHARLLTLR